MKIRLYQTGDIEAMKRITLEGFDGTAIDQLVENEFGVVGGHDWRFRKAKQIEEDCEANPSGVFVAEIGDCVVGYITTRIDRETRKGRIPNLAVDGPAQGQGVGRKLIACAIAYMRQQEMAFVMIETMANNAAGQHLYPACGFIELGRQIHYALRLDD